MIVAHVILYQNCSSPSAPQNKMLPELTMTIKTICIVKQVAGFYNYFRNFACMTLYENPLHRTK